MARLPSEVASLIREIGRDDDRPCPDRLKTVGVSDRSYRVEIIVDSLEKDHIPAKQ